MKLPQKPVPAIPEKNQNPSGLGNMLAQFVGTGDRLSGFSTDSFSITPAARLTQAKKEVERPVPEGSPKKKKRSKLDTDFSDGALSLDLDELDELVGDDDDYDATFDDLIENAFNEDEDIALRNSLISMGRRYAIQSMEENPESSEVSQAFARQERAIEDLVAEIDKDTIAINRDVEQMRMTRTKNYKAMADLISARATMANIKLSAIKELSSIQKDKFDIKLKLSKAAAGGADGEGGMAATQAVQKILSLGRGSLLSSVEDGDDDDDEDYNSNVAITEIHEESDLPPAVTDGDKFIAHEDEGVEYVLDIDTETDDRQIYAVNKHGDVVSDYPLPSNPDQLNFQINELAGEATDQLQRRYRLRRNGEDVNYDSFNAGGSQ